GWLPGSTACSSPTRPSPQRSWNGSSPRRAPLSRNASRISTSASNGACTGRRRGCASRPGSPKPGYPEPMPATDTLGRALRDLRISVTDRCNFRCVYCMPKEVFGRDYEFLARDQLLSFEEIERLAQAFIRHGVQKIRLTGGEPLVRRGIEQLVELLARIPELEDLTLTTNGALLAAKAQALREAGLNRVTVSLDSLD